MTPVTALVLAGSRGPGEPLAQAAGVRHKALLPIAGEPMLARVLRALQACPGVGRIVVSSEEPGLAEGLPGLDPGRPIERLPAAGSPSLSVAAALQALGTPLLVTTADHALLEPAWVTHFLEQRSAEADVAVAVARAETVMAVAPDTQRTFLRFREGAFSGCNLFYLAGPRAAGAVAFWRRIEAERKRPLRMLARLGPLFVLRYAVGRLPVAAALRRFERLTGARPAAVVMPFGRCAIDVDKVADWELVERLLKQEA